MFRFHISPALAISMLALVVAMGGTAAAATGLTRVVIHGGSNTAAVDSSGQLLTADAPPSKYIFAASQEVIDPSKNCKRVYSVPKGKALVLKDATFNVYAGMDPDTYIALYTDSGCGTFSGIFANGDANPYTTTVPIDPGYIVRPGHALYVRAANTSGYVAISGYLISGAAAAAMSMTAVPHLKSPAPVGQHHDGR